MAMMTTRFTVSPDVCSTSDKDGSTILDIEHDKIYSVIGVGSLIWAKLAGSSGGVVPNAIVEDLTERFKEVSRNQIEGDVADLLEKFRCKGIIVVGNESGYFGPSMRHSINRRFTFLTRNIAGLLLNLRLYTLTAFLGLTTINFVLRVLGFRVLCQAIKSWPVTDQSPPPEAQRELCDAIAKAATWYPKQAMCLQRSALTTCLLRYCGVAADMVIGCRKIPFGAHAWVEVDGQVVNDKKQIQNFYKVISRL